MNAPAAEYPELKWRCRRGMLELDILLNGYLDKSYATMDAKQCVAFSELLEYPDNVLLDLLTGKMHSTDQSVNVLVKSIQQAATC